MARGVTPEAEPLHLQRTRLLALPSESAAAVLDELDRVKRDREEARKTGMDFLAGM